MVRVLPLGQSEIWACVSTIRTGALVGEVGGAAAALVITHPGLGGAGRVCKVRVLLLLGQSGAFAITCTGLG